MTNLHLALCALLTSVLATPLEAQELPGLVPVEVPVAGTPEAAVLAGLTPVGRLTFDSLVYERRLRVNELAACRRDAMDFGRILSSGAGDPSFVMSTRRSWIGTLNRKATIETRIQQIDREVARRQGR